MSDTQETLARRIDQALGREPADLVIKHGRILDVATGALLEGDVAVCGDWIVGTLDAYEGAQVIDARDQIVVPGFIDTHLHVESSLVIPPEFDRCALPKGTTTAVCDPHEAANVLGEPGLKYFLDHVGHLAIDLRVQLSSCVPATHLETSGGEIDVETLVRYRDHPAVIGLAEFMNYPGIFAKDPQVLAKLAAFQGDHIDGHAPLLSGRELNAYLACGVKNCHESTRPEEALEKVRKGMQVLIREGTVSRDVEALAGLLDADTWPCFSFCTDDRNPLDIDLEGHLDFVIRKTIAQGAPAIPVYRAATLAAARAFGLADRGIVAPGHLADLVIVGDLAACDVQTVIKAGQVVTPELFANRHDVPEPVGRDSVKLQPVTPALFEVPAPGPSGPVIGIIPGQLVTEHLTLSLPYADGLRAADVTQDALKVCVLGRHGKNDNVGRGFVKGFGVRRGALASSIGHDSHNVIVLGTHDADMAVAVNRLIELQGGFVVARDGEVLADLALPLAGLMSDQPFEAVADGLRALRAAAEEVGCHLEDPFLQLAFLPLPVIPHLKITDMGLVDVDRFQLVA